MCRCHSQSKRLAGRADRCRKDELSWKSRAIPHVSALVGRSLASEGSKFAAPIEANAFVIALAQRIVERSEGQWYF